MESLRTRLHGDQVLLFILYELENMCCGDLVCTVATAYEPPFYLPRDKKNPQPRANCVKNATLNLIRLRIFSAASSLSKKVVPHHGSD